MAACQNRIDASKFDTAGKSKAGRPIVHDKEEEEGLQLMEAFLNSPEADVIREGAYDVLPETPVFGAHPPALGTRC